MAKTLRTSGDYTIKAGSGATGTNQIDLDSKTVRVRGDLIVDGDTTTINTATLSVEDTFIEVARNNSGTTLDAGVYVNRGTAGDNAVFYWDESEDNFIIGTTTNNAGTSPLTILPIKISKWLPHQLMQIMLPAKHMWIYRLCRHQA